MTNEMGASKRLRILSLLLAAACCVTPLAAASPSEEGEPEPPVSKERSDEVGPSGMRIIVDPKTGEVVSTRTGGNRALSEALVRALSRSADGLEVFDLDSGGKGVHLGGRFQHVMTVKVKTDGSLELGCVDSAHKAKDVLYHMPASSADASRDR